MRLQVGALGVMALTALSCYTGAPKLPVNNAPLRLLDFEASVSIEECLVVPRYTKSTGVGSGAGHGPGNMDYEVFLARPFVYRAGEEFRPYEGEASGFLLLGAWIGDSVSLDGVTLIAPGYRSRWVWELWSRNDSVPFNMTPLEPTAAMTELKTLLELLASETITGADRRRWSYAGDGPIGVRFTESERARVRGFLESGAQSLHE